MDRDRRKAFALATGAAGLSGGLAAGRLGARARLWDDVARIGLVSAVLLVILTFRRYGIIWDEEWQAIYGHKILAWYTSFFADSGAFTYSNLHFYGGAFDLAAALVNKVSPLGEYETRHLMGGLVGVLGLAGAWRLGARVGGPRAGVIAGALLFLTPGFWGHAFFNPKDVPFAVAMLWSLVWAVRLVDEMPRPRIASVVAFGLVWGLALGTRVGAVLMGPYLAIALLAHVALDIRRRGFGPALGAARDAAPRLVLALPVAYAAMVLVWPWALLDPLNPLLALTTFAHFSWGGQVLSFGHQLSAMDLPWWYLPGQLLVQLPEIFLAGLAGALLVAVRRVGRGLPPGSAQRLLPLGLVTLAALFPIAYFVVATPSAYHGYRHFIFVVPPLAVLAAIGIDRALDALGRRSRAAGRSAAVAVIGAMLLQGSVMARLFPNEYVYFNSLVGGIEGAEGRFNLDYWGSSLHEAADLLDARTGGRRALDGRPWRVLICGYPLSAAYYLGPNLVATNTDADADFYLSYTESRCDAAIPGKVIAEVRRMGVPLAVVKDRRDLLATH
jgi:hypothetical protein